MKKNKCQSENIEKWNVKYEEYEVFNAKKRQYDLKCASQTWPYT